ncbi:GGDEF domain-containing protein [Trinickia sp. LjRoot230]|uniref:GGDEF domain-containing protein n=1 Tax=Trinickia sp. LjRoot230 TaxID=3342288 RepID=UPI003ECF0DC1
MIDNLLLRMPMGRRFNIGVACALAPVLVLSYFLLTHEWATFRKADDALQRFHAFQSTLIAMEKISAERGPTNGVLGEESPAPAARSVMLRRARIASDERLAQLFAALNPERCPACANDYAIAKKLQRDLAASRAQIDKLAATPRAQRGDRALHDALDHMFAVVTGFGPIAVSQTTMVARGDPSTFRCLVIARLAADLREHAGRLGSRFTSALAMQRPLTLDEKMMIARTRGRIDQLREFINARMFDHPMRSTETFAAVNTIYFGDGMRYVQTIETLASEPGGAHISTGQFAEQYVPLMTPIISFRNTVLDQAQAELQLNRKTTFIAAAITALGELLLLVALILIILGFKRGVLRPLVQATEAIQAIAAGDLAREIPASFARPEIRAMFDALRILKANSVARAQLETERARLIEELETMAETDSLTRLLNRRAFESRARSWCQQAEAQSSRIALIMLDIDFFKRVNDTYGHAVGDDALRMVARLCQTHCTRTDIIARIGGEEFAIMTRVDSIEAAHALAERMRQDIAASTVHADSGALCRITASFGVAFSPEGTPDLAQLLKEADQMLYGAKLAGRDRVMARLSAPSDKSADAQASL